MTKDEIIRMAREAGFVFPETQEDSFTCWWEELERFAALVAEPWIETNKALADHIAASGKVIAETVKQEPVMDNERIFALREAERNGSEHNYFNARPHNDTPTLRGVFCQGFDRGFNKGLKYAAPVERQWVDLTDDEIDSVLRSYTKTDRYKDDLKSYRAVIAADRKLNGVEK